MPRYFFDIHDGPTFRRDDVWLEGEGRVGVRLEVMQALPSIARDKIPKDGGRQAFTVLVRDETDTTVYTATLTFAGLWIGLSPIPKPGNDKLG